jgi:pimeloyl-ACP methyl ester carboxylesterase
LYILAFAAHYPNEVAGMVLLDSTSPNGSVQAVSTEPGSYDLPGRFLALLPAAAHLGLARLVSHASYGSLPPGSRDEARASAATARDVKSSFDEVRASAKAIQQAAAAATDAIREVVASVRNSSPLH